MIFSCVGLFWTGGFSAAEMSCVVAGEREAQRALSLLSPSDTWFPFLISVFPSTAPSFLDTASSKLPLPVLPLLCTNFHELSNTHLCSEFWPSLLHFLGMVLLLLFFFSVRWSSYSFSQNFLTFPLRAVLTTGLPAVVEKWELGWSVSSLLTGDLKVAVFTVS